MLEAHHYTAAAKRKGSYALPEEFDGTVNEPALYHAVRAFLNNQRQGSHATKSRSDVAGGGAKPWRQKGTGRARQGTIRAPHWRGGGVAFGPKPRKYYTDVPRKVRRLARQSALNARAQDGAVHVIETLDFPEPKTRDMVNLVEALGLTGRKVLVLTERSRPTVFLSSRNLRRVHVMPFQEVSAYHVLWADALVIEETAIGGQVLDTPPAPAKPSGKRATAKRTAKKKTAKKTAKKAVKRTTKKAAKRTTKKASTRTPKKKGGDHA